MSKLSVVLLGATLSLFAASSFATVADFAPNQPIQHAQGSTLKQNAAKATKKHAKKKAVRNAKKKAIHSLEK